jgi:hypothetical protein
MSAAGGPELSVVLPTDCWETIRPVVERLRRQTTPARIEVVLVVPSLRDAGLERMNRAGFGAVVVVEVGSIVPLARARAAGVRAATAPLVFLGETHSYPHPGWADALVAAAARDGFSVIVPVFANANPNGVLSCAGFLSDYGGWRSGLSGEELASIPTFNSVYRREVLLELGDRLESALGHGDELVLHLRARGHRAVVAPDAKLDHLNVAQARAFIEERLVTGRLIGANRARRWNWGRRIAYAAAWPLIAVVLAARVLPAIRTAANERPVPAGTGLAMLGAATLKALGEAVGYLFGASSRTESRADEFEVHKLAYAARGRT